MLWHESKINVNNGEEKDNERRNAVHHINYTPIGFA